MRCVFVHGDADAGWWRGGGGGGGWGGGEGAAGVEPAELLQQVLRVQPVRRGAGAHLVRPVRPRRRRRRRARRRAARGDVHQLQAARVEVPVPRPPVRPLTLRRARPVARRGVAWRVHGGARARALAVNYGVCGRVARARAARARQHMALHCC